jgi:NADPH2:quinone reductase
MMSAAIRIYEHGPPEVMRLEDVPVPRPGPGEAVIRQGAVGVNYRDVYVRKGLYPGPALPGGLGFEGAGIVEAVGPGVTHVTVGSRVVCAPGPDNAYALHRLVPADRCVALPNGIDDRTAAAMMVRGMTARYLLFGADKLQRGETALVTAAAGGVGLIVTQWAKHLGARVIGTVGNPLKAATAKAHGCDEVLVLDGREFASRVRALTDGRGVDVVYDSVGRDTFESSLKSLRMRGRMVVYGTASGEPEPIAPRRLNLMGSLHLTYPGLPHYTATRDELEETARDLFDVVGRGIVRIEIGQSYPLAEAAQAHRDLESRKTTGSTILIP